MSERAARLVWAVFAVVVLVLAILAAVQWGDVLRSGRPILYGEGAVAHAALLMRAGSAYSDTTGTVAANYPPLYLALASLGDPLRAGRLVTILSTLSVAFVIDLRARDAGLLARAGLSLAWLALAPVAIWGAGVKPDLLAVALTLGGVALAERSVGRTAPRGSRIGPTGVVAGVLLVAAVWAKPTAALPAAAVIAWMLVRARPAVGSVLIGAMLAAAAEALSAASIGPADLWRHVVVWNQLPWSAAQTLLVGVLGAATLGVLVASAAMARAFRGIALAYLIGALAVALLAGREGATINYLLDLAAATLFALATVASRVRASGALPIASLVQLALGIGLLTPYSILPGRLIATGAWGQPQRAEVVATLGPGEHLVEDSGLLIAEGRTPVVDDLFLWSRLARAGLIDPAPLIARVTDHQLASVVSEADLAHLDTAPAYEQARWDPALVRAILEEYTLDRSTRELWVYRPVPAPRPVGRVH